MNFRLTRLNLLLKDLDSIDGNSSLPLFSDNSPDPYLDDLDPNPDNEEGGEGEGEEQEGADEEFVEEEENNVFEPDAPEDPQVLEQLLGEISSGLSNSTDAAMTVLANQAGFVFTKNIPKIAQKLLETKPELRSNRSMSVAYAFLRQAAEVIGESSGNLTRSAQHLMKGLIEAAKTSPTALDKYVTKNLDHLQGDVFMTQLDSELEETPPGTTKYDIITLFKARILEEAGKRFGPDIAVLPCLLAEEELSVLKTKMLEHIETLDRAGQELFLQTVRMLRQQVLTKEGIETTVSYRLEIMGNYLEQHLYSPSPPRSD